MGSMQRLRFVKLGAAAYQEVIDLLRCDEQAGQKNSLTNAKSERLAAALYDLGLNYLLRCRLLCADSGEGSGLWGADVYLSLPEVVELSR